MIAVVLSISLTVSESHNLTISRTEVFVFTMQETEDNNGVLVVKKSIGNILAIFRRRGDRVQTETFVKLNYYSRRTECIEVRRQFLYQKN